MELGNDLHHYDRCSFEYHYRSSNKGSMVHINVLLSKKITSWASHGTRGSPTPLRGNARGARCVSSARGRAVCVQFRIRGNQ